MKEQITRDEKWLKEKEERHRYALELKKIREEERRKGYSISTLRKEDYTVDKEGYVL